MVKRILAILIVCMLAVSVANPLIAVDTTSAGTVARKTLMELFTATWCWYCAADGPKADRAYDELGPQQVILLRDQVGQDGLDTDETNARASFYRVTGVPTLYVNGLYAYSPADYSVFVQRIRDMNSVAALFQVSVSAQVQSATSQGTAAIEVKSLTSSGYGNLHLIVALFEKVVTYQGTNGVKTHRFVVRDYLFGEMGEQVSLAGFQIRQFSYPLALPNGSNPGDFGIVAWIQDFSTKEILQAESAEIAVAGQGQYTITALAGAGGTIAPNSPQTVSQGGSTTFTVAPNGGYHSLDVTVDSVSVGAVSTYTFTNVQANHAIHATFAITGSAPIGVFRPFTNAFYLRSSTGTVAVPIYLGNTGDVPIIGDWDGNGTDEIGIFRPSTNGFYARFSNGTISSPVYLGNSSDLPIIGNWDGIGTDEIGIFRPSTSAFYLRSSNGAVSGPIYLGNTGDVPIIGDWDGNGTDEIGIFRPSTASFYFRSSLGAVAAPIYLGDSSDQPIIGIWP